MHEITLTPPCTAPAARQQRALVGQLPATVSFGLLASIVVVFLAGSSAPTPLYAHYQAAWGFSAITTTVVFGVYAIAVLAALLTVGSMSDHVGRRPVLIAAVLVQAVAMLVFATATGVPELLLARVLQGLSTGAAVGAVGAGMLDLSRAHGTLANAVGPPIGTATGAIGSALLIRYLPAPEELVYLVLLAILLVQAAGIALMAEPTTPRPGALASLRPRLGLPVAARRPLLLVAPVLVAVWALAGFYGSLGPALVRVVAGSDAVVLGGLALFALAGSGGAATLLLRAAPARTVLLLGTTALIGGVGVTLLAVTVSSAPLFFAGTVLAGVGFGSGFQGSVRTVVPLATAQERAGLLSVVYVVSYLAMGLPAVAAGFLVVHGGGVVTTSRAYGGVVILLAALALLGVLRRQPPAVGTP